MGTRTSSLAVSGVALAADCPGIASLLRLIALQSEMAEDSLRILTETSLSGTGLTETGLTETGLTETGLTETGAAAVARARTASAVFGPGGDKDALRLTGKVKRGAAAGSHSTASIGRRWS